MTVQLDETVCRPNTPLRDMLPAREVLALKRFFNTFEIREYNGDGTFIDRADQTGRIVAWIPRSLRASAVAYSSFFRLVDITDEENGCRVSVTNGEATPTAENCGTVKVNGSEVDVATYTSSALTSAGMRYVWIHTWRDASTGYDSEIRITETSMRPDNPNGGLAYASEPVGEFKVESDGAGGYRVAAGSMKQHFLKGGDHLEILTANCSGNV